MLFGDYSKAISDYNEAIRLREDYSIAFYNRAIARIMMSKRDQACDDLTTSNSLGYEPAKKAMDDFCKSR
jgi:hypothetical protein